MSEYDVVVVLGAQLVFDGEKIVPARHTEFRAHAAGMAYKQGITSRFIVSGGYNVGVRYRMLPDELIAPPDFSFEAFARAPHSGPSEAEVISNFMHTEYDVPQESMILERLSATTQENAQCVRLILSRWKDGGELRKIGVLTQLYHMKRAIEDFRESGLDASPLFAEDVLALTAPSEFGLWAPKVRDFYKDPRGGTQWDAERIRDTMLAIGSGHLRRSVGELLE